MAGRLKISPECGLRILAKQARLCSCRREPQSRGWQRCGGRSGFSVSIFGLRGGGRSGSARYGAPRSLATCTKTCTTTAADVAGGDIVNVATSMLQRRTPSSAKRRSRTRRPRLPRSGSSGRTTRSPSSSATGGNKTFRFTSTSFALTTARHRVGDVLQCDAGHLKLRRGELDIELAAHGAEPSGEADQRAPLKKDKAGPPTLEPSRRPGRVLEQPRGSLGFCRSAFARRIN